MAAAAHSLHADSSCSPPLVKLPRILHWASFHIFFLVAVMTVALSNNISMTVRGNSPP